MPVIQDTKTQNLTCFSFDSFHFGLVFATFATLDDLVSLFHVGFDLLGIVRVESFDDGLYNFKRSTSSRRHNSKASSFGLPSSSTLVRNESSPSKFSIL